MQFIYHAALLLAGFHLTSATPVSDSEQALAERDLVKRACAPTGQESCCAKGFYRVNGVRTDFQKLISFNDGGLVNTGITSGCSVNINRTCANNGGCGGWAISSRDGCSGVELSVAFLDRC